MKQLILFLLLAATLHTARAQDYDTIPPYQKDSAHIPQFTVLQMDSTYINDTKIPKNKPLVIIYFSPTCGHCQLSAQEFGDSMQYMKDIFFVWVTYSHPLSEIKTFAKNFNLQQFNNIIIGRLTAYDLPSYYRVRYTPFMAVYNKQHHLLQTYQQGTSAQQIISLIKQNP